MPATIYSCWKCKSTLEELLLPVSRLAKCPACKADIHVCRMCEFFDPSVSDSCREPIAEKVNDKTRSNFCGYFQPGHTSAAGESSGQDESQAALEDLFGLGTGESNISNTDIDKNQQV